MVLLQIPSGSVSIEIMYALLNKYRRADEYMLELISHMTKMVGERKPLLIIVMLLSILDAYYANPEHCANQQHVCVELHFVPLLKMKSGN